jgi:pimeloyl-ACP methyl ester carboxylesterase
MSNDDLQLNGAGVTIAADSWGDPDAAPVLLLHGGGQTRHAWKGTGEALAREGYYAVSIDLRGHGESGWADNGDYSHHAFVADLLEVLDEFEQPPALVGASLGGLVSLLTLSLPDGPSGRALVLVDVVPRIDQAGAERIGAFMRARPEGFGTLEEAADAVAAYVPGRSRPKDVSGLKKNLRQSDDGRWHWHWDPAFLGGMSRFDPQAREAELVEAAKQITLPTLVVRGGLSDVVSEEGVQEFLTLVPHAEYVNVADASHMVAGDRNDIFTRAVLDFLLRVAPPSPTSGGNHGR